MPGENVVADKSVAFAKLVIAYADHLTRIGQVIIAKQLVRSGTSIGANVWEAQEAESKADFIHKIKLGLKEANETIYWLKLCESIEITDQVEMLVFRVWELKRIMSKIIMTSKKTNRENREL